MAWLSRNNIQPTDSLTADMLNSLANDTRFWGGDVNAGGYKLTNVILSGSGGFERMPSPAVIAPVVAGGASEVQLSDWVAGTPDTFPPRWKMSKSAQPVSDFSIQRYSAGGSLVDAPLSIRMADGIVVLKAQQWTGPVNAEGQTLSNVVLGPGTVFDPGVIAAAQTPWKQDVNAVRHSLLNAERVVALGDGGLITAMDFNINRDVNGNRLMAGPAALFRVDAANSNIFMALYPNGAAGVAVSDPSFPLNFAPGVRMGIGAWNLPKVQVDSDQFHARYIMQPGDFAHSWNLDISSGQWKHVAAGYGNVITNSLGDGNLRIYTSANGAAGAVASLAAVAYFGPGSVRFSANAVYVTGATAAANAWHIFAPWDNAYSPRFAAGMTGDTTRYFVARYNDSGVWVNDPISINRATGVVTVTTLDKASLGSGTPNATTYLRGDGTWAIPPGAGGGQPQTPWAQNIDAAGYNLSGAKNIYALDFRATGADLSGLSGSGTEIAYDTTNGLGIVQAFDRTASGYKQLVVAGSPVSLRHAGGEVLRSMSGGVEVTGDGRFSGYVDTAAGKGFTGNLYLDGSNWRYRAAGAAFLFHPASTAQVSIIYTAPTGAADAVAAVTPALMFRDDGVIEMPRRMDLKFTGSTLREPSAAMHFKRTSGQACAIAMGSGGGVNGTSVIGCMPNSDTFVIGLENGSWVVDAIRFKYPSPTVSSVEIPGILAMSNASGERIILYDGGGGTGGYQNTSMGIENNAWWFKCHSAGHFRWYVGNPPDDGVSAKMYVNGYGTTVNGTVCIGGGNALTLNAHYTDTWRYQGPGNAPAFAMYGDWNMNSIRIMAGVTGSPGGAIAFTEVIQMHPSFVKVLSQFALGYVPTSASGLASGSVWRDAAAGNVLKIVP